MIGNIALRQEIWNNRTYYVPAIQEQIPKNKIPKG